MSDHTDARILTDGVPDLSERGPVAALLRHVGVVSKEDGDALLREILEARIASCTPGCEACDDLRRQIDEL